ncbi:PREDICTED: glycerophosphocholine phosphodiesterase GPCPD1-like [Nicrophorus vespilloides]|uniref:Glycerophosphocholine phosphodiesterase GPCPD1-like n=1 Tax=Nicrophorus vespilloides TaxID=110193 RepID=A0ABM1MC33_NICVS|nr:PREDICTED: glycerophosphocholine phosphodiesterase GPCPD1-like [Nicrophorus vespilloides]XP_017772132.1 PREDICTED: glycerophosphocholine phosphodiesterase GPCPD1-like [Nicrophorus vespilloides]XP_017772133.1 PREDICTED: glycerophosphocholine phosphodiesterase GPCPD1-like [Nicrophorus vespilloides]
MQKWFFLEDPNNANIRRGRGDSQEHSISSTMSQYYPRNWLFRVRVPELRPGEVVCVSGSPPELGSWAPDKVVPLQQEDDSEIWSAVVEIPNRVAVNYRYCVCIVVELGLQSIVRNWESNLTPRRIEAQDSSPNSSAEPELYGDYKTNLRIDKGWLNKETTVQIKLTKDPITIWLPKYVNRNIFIKVTPVNILQHSTNIPKTMSEALEESLSTDTQDIIEMPKHAMTEVADLNALDPGFHVQDQFGEEYKEGAMLIFQSTVLFPQTTAFLVDLYVYSSRFSEGDPPYHAGFSYILPSSLRGSEGNMVLPITSTKHRPMGELRLEYIVIKPLPGVKCDLSLTYARHWKETRQGLDVGHRGAGNSFKEDMKNCAEVRENTIASLKTAIDHGADFVEFDVQLSKDMVPIIYHDFHVCISMKRKKELHETDMLEIPIKDLTFEQLRLLKVYHLSEGKSKNPRFFDEDLEEHQPFPTLQHAFEVLNPHVGFNIEIKWTMQRLDDSYELYHPTDLNLYLDTILEVVLKHAGGRRIIFSCFNPDICSMIRMKQNKYPVMFLTQGETSKWPKYKDPRCWDIKRAVAYANMVEILGVNVHTEDILREPEFVKMAREANLVIFCWGDDNADPATIKYLKELGMHGVIYDKIDQYSSKEVKESIFMVEARESQKDLLRLAAANADVPMSPPVLPIIKERILDVEKARACMDQVSTATSLQSLESTLSDYQKNGSKH